MMQPDEHFPMCPGLLRDVDEESLRNAMDEAHDVLVYVPGTQVRIYYWPLLEGYERLRTLGYGEEDIAFLQREAALQRARFVTICSRLPHDP